MRFPRHSKFGAVKTTIDGHEFASKAEAKRYAELKLLQRAGEITGLILQPRFELQPSFKHAGKTERKIEYVADFQYVAGREVSTRFEVVEDVKGFKTEAYKLKRKLFLFQYGSRFSFLET